MTRQLYTIQMPDGSYFKHGGYYPSDTVPDLNSGAVLEVEPWAGLTAKRVKGKLIPVKIVEGVSE